MIVQIQIPNQIPTRLVGVYVGWSAFVIWNQGRTIKKYSKNLNQEWRYVADLLNRNDIELDDFDLMALPHITKSKIK